jgi:hypothetical protein
VRKIPEPMMFPTISVTPFLKMNWKEENKLEVPERDFLLQAVTAPYNGTFDAHIHNRQLQ